MHAVDRGGEHVGDDVWGERVAVVRGVAAADARRVERDHDETPGRQVAGHAVVAESERPGSTVRS